MTAPLPDATPITTANAAQNGDSLRLVEPGPITIEGQCFLTGRLELPTGFEVPTAKKERQILALLLTEAGQGVSTQRLAYEVWGETLPPSSAQTIQTYVMKLRKRLGDTRQKRQWQVLHTTPTGYRLQVDPSWVDVLRFTHATKGIWLYENESEERLRSVMATIDAAIFQLRGPILPDVECGPLLGDWVTVFNESITQAESRWTDAALRLRMYNQVIVRLLPLSQADPLCENFVRWRMLALYCCSRGGEALRIYRELWDAMVKGLGLEPGPQTRSLQQKILSRDDEPLRNPLPFI